MLGLPRRLMGRRVAGEHVRLPTKKKMSRAAARSPGLLALDLASQHAPISQAHRACGAPFTAM